MSSMLKAVGVTFDQNAAKSNLKMASGRLGILINKKTVNIKANKREVSKLLAIGKEDKARIRVEQIIREGFDIEAYEILELQCDLLAERMRLLVSEKHAPQDLEQSICTVIWAATRAHVPELEEVKKQFTKKYGVGYVRRAVVNEGGCVNPRVVDKLSVLPPSGYLVHGYLTKIAKEYNVPWESAFTGHEDDRRAVALARRADWDQPEAPPPPLPPADNSHDPPPPYTPTAEYIPVAPSNVPRLRPQPSYTVQDIPLAPGSLDGPPPTEVDRRGSDGSGSGGGSVRPMPDSGIGNISLQPSVVPKAHENAGPRRGSGESGMAGLAYDDLNARLTALRKAG